MRLVRIRNTHRPEVTPIRAGYCESFGCQLRGLTFRRSLAADEGLLLVQARQNRVEAAIHMLMMFIDLAVIWLDDRRQVVDVQLARRWRPAYVPAQPARYILETGVHRLNDFQVGDVLEFDDLTHD